MNFATVGLTSWKYFAFPIPIIIGMQRAVRRYIPLQWMPSITRNSTRSKEIAEREDEARKRSELEDQLQKAGDEFTNLEEKRAKAEQDIRRLDDQNKQLQELLQRERDDKTKLQEKLWREAKEKGDLQESVKRTLAEYGSLKQRSETQDREIKAMKNELVHLIAQRDETHALLETRTRELKGAQAFLTKADILSGAEVIAMVEGLNSEIMQTAAFITDSFDFDREQADKGIVTEASARVNDLLGSMMAHLLNTIRHSDDPMLIQIALQASMAAYSVWMVGSWDFDVLQAEQPLAEIYADIQELENQAVAGRWRALTRAHAQRIGHRENDDVSAALVTHLSDALVEVLVAAGCAGTYEATYRTFASKFGERLLTVVKMALRLNKAIGEDVTSADLQIIHFPSGQTYNPASMVDAFGEDKVLNEDSQGTDHVLCTTDLGLRRTERVSKEGKAEFQVTVLRRPKVALETVVESMEKEDMDT